MSETFSTRVRYTGVTLGYQIGAALAGGTVPLIATWLLREFDGSWVPIAINMVFLAVIGLGSAIASAPVVRRETAALKAAGRYEEAD